MQISVPKENNDNEDAGEESDTGSTNSSHRLANNNLPTKLLDPMAYLTFDKVCLILYIYYIIILYIIYYIIYNTYIYIYIYFVHVCMRAYVFKESKLKLFVIFN